MTFEWQKLCFIDKANIRSWRVKVIGGWVLRTECWDDDRGMSESSVFIPDPNHQWIFDIDAGI